MSTLTRIVASALVLAGTTRIVAADRDIVIETPGERSTNAKILLAGLVGAGLVVGGSGVVWHLDSREASDELSTGKFTGKAWTHEDIALFEQADRSKTRATIAYSIGGALLIGAAIAFIVTDPGSETTVITPSRTTPTVSGTEGGAVLGGMWSF